MIVLYFTDFFIRKDKKMTSTRHKVLRESFKAGLPDLKQAQQSSSTTKPTQKLTGSFNAGLKDLRIAINKTKQTTTSNTNSK